VTAPKTPAKGTKTPKATGKPRRKSAQATLPDAPVSAPADAPHSAPAVIAAPYDVPQPVFILAAPRSYSSLVAAMIGQHPDLYGMPELNLFHCETIAEFNSGITPEGTKKSPFWATMRHGLLRAVAQIHAAEQSPEAIRMAERWLKQREDLTSGEVFTELARAMAPRRIVEKSPGVLRHRAFLDRMRETFPGAKYIHLLRHPLPQGQSALTAKGGSALLMALNSVDYRGDTPALEPQIAWHDAQIRILRFLDDLPDDSFVTLRGEDFLNDLDGHLPALCRWLGISDSPEAIAEMRHPERSPYSVMGPVNAPLGNDVNFLTSPALREGKVKLPPLDDALPWRKDGAGLHPRVSALAQALGYR
jgi:hypothetical protein